MKKLLSVVTIITLSLMISSKAKAHFFDLPYKCTYESTSKRTGKVRTSLYYYHPKKNWYLRLGAVKSSSPLKVANLYTPEGRYDGSYKGSYPNNLKAKLGNYWPYKSKKVVKVFSKLSKSNCELLKDESMFNHPYLSSLECMDPKGLGTCTGTNR